MKVLIISDSQTRTITPERGTYLAYHKNQGNYTESPEPRDPIQFEVPPESEVIQIVFGGWTIKEGWTPEIQEIVYQGCHERNWEPGDIDAIFIIGGLNELRGNPKGKYSEEEYQIIRNQLVRNVEYLMRIMGMKLSYRARKYYLGAGATWFCSLFNPPESEALLIQSKARHFTLFSWEIKQRAKMWRKRHDRWEYWNIFATCGSFDVLGTSNHLNTRGNRKIAQEIGDLLVIAFP